MYIAGLLVLVASLEVTFGHTSNDNADVLYIPAYKVKNIDGCSESKVSADNTYITREEMVGLVANMLANITETIIKYSPNKPRDCQDLLNYGYTSTGIYTIYPEPGNLGISVRCDMDTTTGGWTVFQRRISDSDFYKNWTMYEDGFGDLNSNFWLGNRYIHMLTNQGDYELRVDLTSFDDETAYAQYSTFSLGDAPSKYKLTVGGYSGTAGDAFVNSGNGMMFSTFDEDNDIHESENCAVTFHGAWWYSNCHGSNLNGDYGNKEYAKGPVWEPWKGYYEPMKITEMKIKINKH